jgi:hypothetical protein
MMDEGNNIIQDIFAHVFVVLIKAVAEELRSAAHETSRFGELPPYFSHTRACCNKYQEEYV